MSERHGYVRPGSTTVELAKAIADALYANPEQRLGQLLINISRRDDGSESDIWNKHDEEWIRILIESTQTRPGKGQPNDR